MRRTTDFLVMRVPLYYNRDQVSTDVTERTRGDRRE